MKKLNLIKKQLKKNKLWKEYKNKFEHPQMKFVASKIILACNASVSLQNLISIELKMMQANSNDKQKMFIKPLETLNSLTKMQADWEDFSICLFYVYQTSTYKKDLKRNVKNIYRNNIIEANSAKRDYYNKWISSLDFTHNETNLILRKIIKVVF